MIDSKLWVTNKSKRGRDRENLIYILVINKWEWRMCWHKHTFSSMAFSAALSHVSFSTTSSSSSSSTTFLTRNPRIQLIPIQFRIRAVQSSEPAAQKSDAETKVQDSPPPTTKPPLKPKKPVYSSQYTHTFMFTYRLQRAGFGPGFALSLYSHYCFFLFWS